MDSKKQYSSFLGNGWSFPPSFLKEEKGVKMVSKEQDIEESLQILLSTRVGERIMNPEYGCNLNDIVFNNISANEETLIIEMIRLAILHYEPRIILNDIDINTSNINEGVLTFTIDYTIRTTNSRANYVFPFYLIEGTITN